MVFTYGSLMAPENWRDEKRRKRLRAPIGRNQLERCYDADGQFDQA